MTSQEIRNLSRAVNFQARNHYSHLVEQTGRSSLVASLAPRLALQRNTPYPYSFTEDCNLFPQNEKGFGRVIKRGRNEGLREIHSSIGEQEKEHQWLYVAELASWIDITLSSTAVDVNADEYVRVFLSHIFSEIEAVHTHPDSTVRNLAKDEFCWSYSDNYLLEAARPSGSDLVGHVQMTARTAQSSKASDSIVSHYGVTTFSVNEVGAGTGYHVSRRPYDETIKGTPSDPIAAIRTALNAMQSHYVLFDSEMPAFLFEFEPFVAA